MVITPPEIRKIQKIIAKDIQIITENYRKYGELWKIQRITENTENYGKYGDLRKIRRITENTEKYGEYGE